MGGAHVAADYLHGLQVSGPDAERLKTMHGGLIATGLDDRDMIRLPSILGDWDHDRRRISRFRAHREGVMRPRVEKILEEVQAQLDASGFEYPHRNQRIDVLTGRSSRIRASDRGERILGERCRIGKPLRVQGLPQSAHQCGVFHRRRALDTSPPAG